ncbi:MAG: OmpH family outer membrane protein [Bacillota bacterium]
MLQGRQLTKILAVAVVISLGIGGALFLAPQAEADSKADETIAYVNVEEILAEHPRRDEVNQEFEEKAKQKKKELQSELKSKVQESSGEERQKLIQSYNQRLQKEINQYNQELTKPLVDDIMSKVNQVAKEKGFKVVLKEDSVVYGGYNLTDEIIAKLQQAETATD